MGRSSCSVGRQPPEGPPLCTALNFLPPRMPPAISKTISRRVMPIGTSARPVLLILPVRQNTLLPLLFSVPLEAYQSPPFLMMNGTLAKVSTLFRQVGFIHRPLWAGNGGLTRG